MRGIAHEPHRFKTIRNISLPGLEERKRHLQDVRFNVFHLTPTQLTFDMAAPGMGAMSQEQLAGLLTGDEAYAGARNLGDLEAAVAELFGKSLLCPTHSLLGAVELVVATMVQAGDTIATNAVAIRDLFEPRQARAVNLRQGDSSPFSGDLELAALETLSQAGVALLWLEAFADGCHPISLANLRDVRDIASRHGLRLVLDGSRIVENAWAIQHREPGQGERLLAAIIAELAGLADVLAIDATQDARCQTGALLATNDPDDHDLLTDEATVLEGPHSAGGMAGRTMAAFAIGVREMASQSQADWILHQVHSFHALLRDGDVPFVPGCDGAYIRTDTFLPHLTEHQQDSFSAALYLSSGIRAVAGGQVGRDMLVPVEVPRLSMTTDQLEQIADAIVALYHQRQRISALATLNVGAWRDEMRYRWIFPVLDEWTYTGFPYVISVIERTGQLTRKQRRRAIERAGHNTFLLQSTDVAMDFLSDAGTAAMSTDQWADLLRAVPTPTASDEYHLLVELLQDALGYEHIIPTHQARAAEHILSQCHIQPGQRVPKNGWTTSTPPHQERAGGILADVIVDQANDPSDTFRWKGNIDLSKLEAIVDEHGADRVAYVSLAQTVDLGGGQPASMDNMKEVYAYCSARGIPVFFDSARCMENACMIARYDDRYEGVPAREVLREMMTYGDGCTIGGMQGFIANIGGILAFKDNTIWKAQAEELLRISAGNVTDGGLPSSDLGAMAQGIEELLDDSTIFSRVEAAALLAELLHEAGVPVTRPPGSHGIVIDAGLFLPHIPQGEFPAQRLAAEIYVETGARTLGHDSVSAGPVPDKGEGHRLTLGLVRLTLPHRAYSHDHTVAVAAGIARLHQQRHAIRGLKMIREPSRRRRLQGRFEAL